MQQVVLTRLAATFGGTGAALALVDNGQLIVSTDASLSMRVATRRCLSLDDPLPLAEATRTGEPLFFADEEEFLRRWPHADPVLQWPSPEAAASVTPLGPAGDQPLGAWVVTYDSGHRPSADENAFMITLAELAGQALVRIRSQQARVELATAVQQHMLPTLPERLPGLEIAARYRPCGTGLDIGGDCTTPSSCQTARSPWQSATPKDTTWTRPPSWDRCAARCAHSPPTSRTPQPC